MLDKKVTVTRAVAVAVVILAALLGPDTVEFLRSILATVALGSVQA